MNSRQIFFIPETNLSPMLKLPENTEFHAWHHEVYQDNRGNPYFSNFLLTYFSSIYRVMPEMTSFFYPILKKAMFLQHERKHYTGQ